MCTTSAECKTIMTVVLTVMSIIDPNMINWNLRWDWFGWESGQSYCLGQTTPVDSVVGSMSRFKEKRC
jgi:hypothetical protein